MERKRKFVLVVAAILIASIYYYIKLPALNIHSEGFWAFVIVVSALCFAVAGVPAFRIDVSRQSGRAFSLDKGKMTGWRKIFFHTFLFLTINILQNPEVDCPGHFFLIFLGFQLICFFAVGKESALYDDNRR